VGEVPLSASRSFAGPIAPDKLLLVADMAGTLIFAVEGATAAVRADLDLLGLLVLGFAVALGGGLIRDVLIGAVPPAALGDWRYAATAFSGAMIVFFLHRQVLRVPAFPLMVLDAAGLSLFAMAGAHKALLYRMHPFIAVLLGAITGVGGGIIRDLFLAQVPNVLHADIYATAALAGAAVMIAARKLRVPTVGSAVLGWLVCFLLRVVSVWRHWNLPHVSQQ
jgi:uncharacterized membrane protein YeiH